MWIKITDKEIQENKVKERRKVIVLIILTFILFFISTFVVGKLTGDNLGRSYMPKVSISWQEIIPKIPKYLILSLIITLVFSLILVNKTNKYICTVCDKIIDGKNLTKCKCGGDLIDLKSVKWIDNDKLNDNYKQ